MLRLCAALVLLPAAAAADWAPRPAMFSYDATFAQCLIDPTAPDLAADCATRLADAYVLKRAVAWGAFHCADQDLMTCATPFEDQGLPHIAVQIAVGVGCNGSDIASSDPKLRLDPEHCVSIAADIMIDEGVVPLSTQITCIDGNRLECDDLAAFHTQYWEDEILAMTGQDPLILDLLDRSALDCAQSVAGDTLNSLYHAGLTCVSDRYAAIWADLKHAQQDQ